MAVVVSAVAASNYAQSQQAPFKDETVEEFAERLFNVQVEVYSAHAGSDLPLSWSNVSTADKQAWYKAARNHPHALVAWRK